MAAERYDAATMPEGSVWEIDDGWDVLGVDGEQVGVIQDIEPEYIVVARGFLFQTERYVPVSAITNVEPGTVYLNVSRSEINERGWTSPSALVKSAHTGDARAEPQSDGRVASTEELNRRLADAHLICERQPVEAVEAIGTPIREDGLVAEDPHAFAHLRITIPIYGEIAVVRKRPVIYEMLGIVRGLRERQLHSRAVVRREEISVIPEGTAPVIAPDLLAMPGTDAALTSGPS